MPADQFKPEELISILEDAIEADEVEFVRSQYARAEGASQWTKLSFLKAAARTASPTMVDLLLEKYASITLDNRDNNNKVSALCAAIRGENMAVIKHLIARGANVNPLSGSVIQAALHSCNPEIVEILLGHSADLVECPSMFDTLLSTHEKKEEDEIFKVLHQMRKYVVGKKAFSSGLIDVLWRSSIPLAKYFIDNGADVNSRDLGYGAPILYDLVRKFSHCHVEAITFLLQQGADPYPTNSYRKSIKSLAGMRKVEKYFGKSWDDLVREAQPERASTTNEG
jgi:ankyrin repeat protein